MIKIKNEYKNLKFGTPPDGVVLKIWFWAKNSNSLNWAIYSEYKDEL